MHEQIRNRIALTFALFCLVSLPSFACSYFGSLYFTSYSAWFGAVIAFVPYLVSSLLLLFFVRPHVGAMNNLARLGKSTLVLAVVSIGLVILLSINIGNQDEINIRVSLVLALVTWCAGFFSGLTIIALGNPQLFGRPH
jgi:chromate transport protein ChrA